MNKATGIDPIRTPFYAPLADAICARFVVSLKRDYSDHVLIFGPRQLGRILTAHVNYFYEARRHQRFEHGVLSENPVTTVKKEGRVVAFPVSNGLHRA